MINIKNTFVIKMCSLLLICFISCSFKSQKEVGKTNIQEVGEAAIDLPHPQLADNKVVAHRGGSIELSCPDNSIEALNYAIDLGCFASECDIYLTKDERVIVAHADNKDRINGLHPWEATCEEIRSAGLLENGENIPTLEDYLDRVLQAGTIVLWLDVKSISALPASAADELSSRCAEKASEIIRKKKADNFVEFIVAKENILKRTLAASNGSWSCGLMNTKLSPDHYTNNSYEWANFSISAVFYHNGQTKGEYIIDDYTGKGIRVSVYNVDSEDDRRWYVSRTDKLYALTTNYPKALLGAMDHK